MSPISLPTRTGPKHGVRAFDEDGEMKIWEAVKVHKMPKIKVGAETDCSIVTVDAILKRVEARLAAQKNAPVPDADAGQ